jgi:hypothetical protein
MEKPTTPPELPHTPNPEIKPMPERPGMPPHKPEIQPETNPGPEKRPQEVPKEPQ